MEEDHYISLIYKKLDGLIDPGEMQELQQWLNASAENRRTAEAIEVAWKESSAYSPEIKVDLDVEFAALQKEIEASEPVVRKLETSRTAKPWKWLVAAGLAIFLTTTIVLQNQSGQQWVEVSTQGEAMTITLADNSTVKLNANSHLEYPEEFDGTNRNVRLEGEAFFEITRDPNKPFTIETSHEVVEVLGTSFNVDAQEGNGKAVVYVASGKVKFGALNASDFVTLEAGNKGIFERESKSLSKIEEASPNEISWLTGELHFADTPLSEVLMQVGKLYRVSIELADDNMKNCPFTSDFNDLDLDEILETIALVNGAEIVKTSDNSFILKGGTCG